MRSYPLGFRFAGLAAALLPAVVLAAGCSSGPMCAVDSDCALGDRCSAGTCQRVGVATDSGPTGDTGPRDGAVTDARSDAGRTDTGPADAGSDAGPTCPDAGGSYSLSTFGPLCALTYTTMTLTESLVAACTFAVQLDASDAGSLEPESGLTADQLGGTLTLGAAMPHCIATFTAADSTLAVVCDDGCSFTGTRSPGP